MAAPRQATNGAAAMKYKTADEIISAIKNCASKDDLTKVVDEAQRCIESDEDLAADADGKWPFIISAINIRSREVASDD
jgi:hypothetical protein